MDTQPSVKSPRRASACQKHKPSNSYHQTHKSPYKCALAS
ncbi:hypothetical protein CPL00134L_CDS0077 [Escherichia phage Phagiculus]